LRPHQAQGQGLASKLSAIRPFDSTRLDRWKILVCVEQSRLRDRIHLVDVVRRSVGANQQGVHLVTRAERSHQQTIA
jgi:hypothetical protein